MMKILFADDSSFIRSIILKTLKANFETAEIISCINGKEAYEQFVAQKPDILITDLLMPEMTGEELLHKLNDNGYHAKAIVVSADIQTKTKEELVALGLLDFVNKPLTVDKLNLIVNLIRGQENA